MTQAELAGWLNHSTQAASKHQYAEYKT